MTSNGNGKLAKGLAGVMLTVCAAAAGIYFSDWSNKHPHVLIITIAVSLVLAVLLGIVGFVMDHGKENAIIPTVSTHAATGVISTTGSNYAPQVAGNTGNIHIGNVLHAPHQPQAQRDYRNEWLALADKMSANCRFLRADWALNNILGETWRVPGGPEKNMCQAWMRQAGAMLLASPRVREQLPQSVAEDPNDLERWLRYLKERYIFQWGHFAEGVEPNPETGVTEYIQMGTVPDLANQSAKACIDCSTLELR